MVCEVMENTRPIDGSDKPRRRVLAVASGGGHWVQMLRMMSAFNGHEVIYASTIPSLRSEVAGHPFYSVPDANRRRPFALLYLILKVLWILIRQRPDFVISTGAAPGYVAIVLGKLFRAQTIWVDSIANVDKLSMSGRLVGRHADLWLTQWPHLAQNHGPHFVGAVI